MGVRLTDKLAMTTPPPERGNRVVWDDKEVGLGVRVTASENGARAWVLRYIAPSGKERRMVLGPVGTINATMARRKAKQVKAAILTNGEDPLAKKAQARKEGTVAALAAAFDAEHIAHKRPETQAQYRRMLRKVILPALGRMRPAEVTSSVIRQMHSRTRATGKAVTANRAHAVCSALFNFAVETGRVPSNPCRGIRKLRAPEDARVRFLSADELQRLIAVLNEWPDQQAADAVRLLVLSGSRKSEVQSMRWADIQGDTWRKPAWSVKQARTHAVPLSAPAQAILARLREEATPAALYVFPSPVNPGKPIGHLSHVFRRMAKKAGLADFRLHDARHHFAATLASSGESLLMIGQLLGHSSPSITQKYAHLSPTAQRASIEKAGRLLEAVAAGRTADVVPLPARAAK